MCVLHHHGCFSLHLHTSAIVAFPSSIAGFQHCFPNCTVDGVDHFQATPSPLGMKLHDWLHSDAMKGMNRLQLRSASAGVQPSLEVHWHRSCSDAHCACNTCPRHSHTHTSTYTSLVVRLPLSDFYLSRRLFSVRSAGILPRVRQAL